MSGVSGASAGLVAAPFASSLALMSLLEVAGSAFPCFINNCFLGLHKLSSTLYCTNDTFMILVCFHVAL